MCKTRNDRFLKVPELRADGDAPSALVPASLEGAEMVATADHSPQWFDELQAWLPDGDSHNLRSYLFGPSGFWTMAPLRCAAKFDPFLSLDCTPTHCAIFF